MCVFSKEHYDQWRFIIGLTKPFQFKIDIDHPIDGISGMTIYFLWLYIFIGFAKGSSGIYLFGKEFGGDK